MKDELQTYERVNVTWILHLLINLCVKCVFNARYYCVKHTNYEWLNFTQFPLLSYEMLSCDGILWDLIFGCCISLDDSMDINQLNFVNEANYSKVVLAHDDRLWFHELHRGKTFDQNRIHCLCNCYKGLWFHNINGCRTHLQQFGWFPTCCVWKGDGPIKFDDNFWERPHGQSNSRICQSNQPTIPWCYYCKSW